MSFEFWPTTMSYAHTAESMDWGDCIWLTSDPDVVTARERGRALAETLGFSQADQAAVETTISELAINMLTYARSGEIRIEVVTNGPSTGLRVVARDWNTGIENVELADMAGLTGDFDIQRRVGRGTVVSVTKWLRARSPAA